MHSNLLYLLIDACVIIIPLIFSFHPAIKFHKEWKYFIPANIITGIAFIAWDAWFTSMGVWDFNPRYVTGIELLGLPVEEILFFLCIPYACMFTLHALKNLYPGYYLSFEMRDLLNYILIIETLLVALIFFNRIYTAITFFSFSVVLFITVRIMKEKIDHFYLMYLIILLPFFIVNGILTGSWIEGEVVSYNNAENLGIRLGTIPIEDAFYGMTLLLLHFLLMELFARKQKTEMISQESISL